MFTGLRPKGKNHRPGPRKIHIGSIADIEINHKLGSDVALINGIMSVIVSKGLYDKKFIEERTEGFDKLEALLKDYPPEKVSEYLWRPR